MLYRDVRYRDMYYHEEGYYVICAIGTCAIGMCAIGNKMLLGRGPFYNVLSGRGPFCNVCYRDIPYRDVCYWEEAHFVMCAIRMCDIDVFVIGTRAILCYWEYKLVQSVFFVHLFQNKKK